jgi:hypothetical protein
VTQQPDYLRYLESAKQAELANQLQTDGFEVETDKKIGDLAFDVVAKRGNQAIAYEIRSVGSRRVTKDVLRRLQVSAKEAGLEFRIVIVNPPPRVKIEIPKLRLDLSDYMINHSFPSELDSLSSATLIENVVDIEISDVRIDEDGTRVEGTGTVEVTLQYGGSSDSVSSRDAYPFEFSVRLKPDTSLASVDKLTVDTSSFYE